MFLITVCTSIPKSGGEIVLVVAISTATSYVIYRAKSLCYYIT